MIPEKRFLNQIQQVLARLMQPLWLLDTEGTVLLPEENRSKINLPEFMEPGMPVRGDARLHRACGRDGAVHGSRRGADPEPL